MAVPRGDVRVRCSGEQQQIVVDPHAASKADTQLNARHELYTLISSWILVVVTAMYDGETDPSDNVRNS